MKKISLLFAIFFAIPLAWGAEVYTSNLDNTTLTGATVTVSNCALAPAPTWGSGFTNAFLTSSSSGYATIEFDPALDLSGYDNVELTVQWGSASGRPLNASFNGGSNVSISGNLPSADRSKVVSSSCIIGVSTLNSLKLVSSGGGNVYFFAISITGTSSCSATQPGSINKGTVSGGVITLTAGGSPAASNTWYWQTAADGTATTESGATKNVSAAGTYYIRSYHASEDCWSAAQSVTVEAEDFYTPCETPTITAQPNSSAATYDRGDAAAALSVTASVGDGGTLSYQWYSNTTATNSGGILISGATSSSYTPSTTTAGTLYYYCVVTNSLASHSSVSATSNVSGAITVESSCPGTGGGIVFGWTPKTGLADANISAGTHDLPGEWLESLTGGSAQIYVNSGGNMRIRNSELNYNSSDVYIHVTLDCPLWEGDIISITSTANANQIKITTNAIKPSSSGSILAATITQGTDFAIPSGNALIGLTEFYLWRNSSSTNIGTVTITRPKTGATYTWTCPTSVTQGSNTTISVASDCSEPVTLAWINSPIDGVSFNTTTGELTVGPAVPLGTTIKINASNAAGSCAATSETKNIIVDLPAPIFVWNYDATVNAGARYPISVTSPDGVTITLTLLDDPVPAGIATNITGNSGTYDVQGTFLGTTLTFQASSAATGSFCAHTETRVVNVNTCFTNKMIYVTSSGYINAGGSAKPRYYIDQVNIGRILKDFGGSSSSPSAKSATIDGYNFTYTVGSLNAMCINPYVDNVVKVRIYLYGSGSTRTVTGVYYSPEYYNSKDSYTDITSSSRVVYESGTSFGSSNTYVDIYPSVTLNAMEYLYITFSGGANIYGVDLVTTGGSEPTSIAWTTTIPGGTKRVTEGDAPFTYTAAQTGSVHSLGTLSYTSSDPQVATVDPLTGEVTILDNGSSIITATLSASGCYAEATATYRVEVNECQDDPCLITSLKTFKCPGDPVTLTVDNCEEFATIAWYKDGILIPGETGMSYDAIDPGEYKAVASKNCHQHSNIIAISDLTAAPTIEAIYTYYYVKNNPDDFHSTDLALFTISNADVITANQSISGCTFEIEDGKVYLRGKPVIGANSNVALTVTARNSCTGEEDNASMELRLLAATAQPTVAWVVVGPEGGGFTNVYEKWDGDSQDTYYQHTGNALFEYLNSTGGYSLTAVNDYATTDETLIAQYYSQFDLIIMTDFPNSKETDTNKKSYTNAVGSLIDVKPMLSTEAFVSAQPNWRISSDPYNPSSNQHRMKLLCAAHQIFDPAIQIGVYKEGGNEYVDVITSATLQGFSPVSIPDFIFIATIDGGTHGELVTCCERQTVIQARFMILGIQLAGLGAMVETTGKNAKQMVKQILDYLLIADPTLIADCSLVFDNGEDPEHPGTYLTGGGDHLWDNPVNWGPNHGSLIPSPFHAVRIEQPCKVNITDAHASSARLAHGSYLAKHYNGSIEVLSTGALSLSGFIKRTYDGDFLTRHDLKEGDVTVHADASHNGAFIWGDPSGDVPATVDLYSKAYGSGTSSPVWQYIGSPFASRMTAIEQFYEAWMCRWSYVSNPALGGTWNWVLNEDRIDPFVGYTITQASAKTYTWTGQLNKPETKVVPLVYSSDADGFAMIANSWVAPINVAAMETGDFDGADPTIYIFNTGTYAQYVAEGDPAGDSRTESKTGAGQYSAIPVNAASYIGISTIPPMQGFFVQTTRNGNLTLDYRKIVMDTVHFESSTTPMRAPRRFQEGEEPVSGSAKTNPEVMRLNVISESWGDKVFLLAHSEFSDAYELGWEGRKQEGDVNAPYLSVNEPSGEMSVAAVNSFDERELNFRAGCDTEYTFSFNYNGETIYLYDRLTGEATEIKTGNTYSFTAKNKTPAKRFLITQNPPRVPTDIEDITVTNLSDAEKCIIDGQLYIIKDNRFYDARGVRVTSFKRKEVAP